MASGEFGGVGRDALSVDGLNRLGINCYIHGITDFDGPLRVRGQVLFSPENPRGKDFLFDEANRNPFNYGNNSSLVDLGYTTTDDTVREKAFITLSRVLPEGLTTFDKGIALPVLALSNKIICDALSVEEKDCLPDGDKQGLESDAKLFTPEMIRKIPEPIKMLGLLRVACLVSASNTTKPLRSMVESLTRDYDDGPLVHRIQYGSASSGGHLLEIFRRLGIPVTEDK